MVSDIHWRSWKVSPIDKGDYSIDCGMLWTEYVFLSTSYVETLTLMLGVFGDRAFGKIIKVT